jgi:predicted nucleotide-binding protein (sugar kinase/HSP70/actin superfamily)
VISTIGLPRSLLYHKYRVLWHTFFEGLGLEPVVSGPSNQAILQRGTQLAVDETCLPLKLMLGHVDSLRDRADAVLVPRIASLARDEEACVKFMGVYDVARNVLPDVPLIGYNVDVMYGHSERAGFQELGRKLGQTPWSAAIAYERARRAHLRHESQTAALQREAAERPGLKMLVVGHPYNLHDELIGKPISEYLESQGVTVLSAELGDVALARKLASRLSTDVPWTFNKELLGGVEAYRDKVDGIIFLVTFPCGPDSLVTELCLRKIKDRPTMSIVLDEQQGEAGVRTRLESFVDLVRMRRGDRVV